MRPPLSNVSQRRIICYNSWFFVSPGATHGQIYYSLRSQKNVGRIILQKGPHVYFSVNPHSSFSYRLVRAPHSTPSAPFCSLSLSSPLVIPSARRAPLWKRLTLRSKPAKNHRIRRRWRWMRLLRDQTRQIRQPEAIWSGSIRLDLARIRRWASVEMS
jgi:hypothetical protein